MTSETVMTIFQHALELMTVLLLVSLVPSLVVGLLVSLIQAATQINEMTLSFIPKLLIMIATLMIAGPYMLRLLLDYTHRLIEQIPTVIG